VREALVSPGHQSVANLSQCGDFIGESSQKMAVLRVKGSSQNATFAKEEEEEAGVWMYKKGWRS
jgi:hypothetical protein